SGERRTLEGLGSGLGAAADEIAQALEVVAATPPHPEAALQHPSRRHAARAVAHFRRCSALAPRVTACPDWSRVPPADHSTLEVAIERLTYGPDALAHYEGRVVFAPLAAPGDLVRARIVEQHRGFLRAELADVVRAGPDRVAPRCPV